MRRASTITISILTHRTTFTRKCSKTHIELIHIERPLKEIKTNLKTKLFLILVAELAFSQYSLQELALSTYMPSMPPRSLILPKKL